jgi:hypothetical protein
LLCRKLATEFNRLEQLVVSYKFIQLDVFTDEPFTGNALAVFPEAPGLSDEQMQRVARFVLSVLLVSFVGLTAIGGLKTASFLFGWSFKGMTPLGWLHKQLDSFDSWMAAHLPDRVWTAAHAAWPLIIALALIVLLWRRARVSNIQPSRKKGQATPPLRQQVT